MFILFVCVCVVVVQLLQEDLELEQVRVNSLTHMVVVVDESSGDSATAALESKLQVSTLRGCPLGSFSSPVFNISGDAESDLNTLCLCFLGKTD